MHNPLWSCNIKTTLLHFSCGLIWFVDMTFFFYISQNAWFKILLVHSVSSKHKRLLVCLQVFQNRFSARPYFLPLCPSHCILCFPLLSLVFYLCVLLSLFLLKCERHFPFAYPAELLSLGVRMTGSQPDGTEQVWNMWPPLLRRRGGRSEEKEEGVGEWD